MQKKALLKYMYGMGLGIVMPVTIAMLMLGKLGNLFGNSKVVCNYSCVFAKRNYRVLVGVYVCVCVCV